MRQAEINAIVYGDHGAPHNFLGMHHNGGLTTIRAFIPGAISVTCINTETNEKHNLKKVHDNGFFELILKCQTFSYKLYIDNGNSHWQTIDPYSFDPYITEYDIYLFKNGTHYDIYNKLGANKVTINGIEGFLFAVWAPNARRVSVVGSFNNWDGRTHPMTNIYGSGIFEIFIPGLSQYDMYKFEIKTYHGELRIKSDPYAKFSELRPGKASFVYDISGYEWGDNEYMKNKYYPMNGPMTIYEVHLGSWKRGEVVKNSNGEEIPRFLSYTELADELVSYVKEMGYTHIEIMPIQEHPLDMSWGYQVTGYYSVTSRFGNPHEFMYFVDKCHQAGIGVILDWVPAHFPKDDNGLANFDGTALYEHEDDRKGEHKEWGTKVFNFGRKEVSNFLIANALYWLEMFHLDGLRIDAVSSMLYLDYNREEGQWIANKYGGRENEEAVEFIKHLNSILLDRFPHALLIAEESTSWPQVSRPPEQGGLGFNLKWNMGWMNDFLSYIAKEPIHRSYHHNNITFAMMYAHTENFILVVSHDEVVHGKGSMIGKMPGDLWQKFSNMRLSYGFMYGHPGKNLLFMGQEFGQFDEWKENQELQWNLLEHSHHKTAQLFMKDLNHMYKETNELWAKDFGHEGFSWISVDNYEQSIVAFARYGKNDRDITIVVANFTPVTYQEYRIGAPVAGQYREILNSDNEKYGGSGVVNQDPIWSQQINAFGYENSITIKIPPLGVTYLKLV